MEIRCRVLLSGLKMVSSRRQPAIIEKLLLLANKWRKGARPPECRWKKPLSEGCRLLLVQV